MHASDADTESKPHASCRGSVVQAAATVGFPSIAATDVTRTNKRPGSRTRSSYLMMTETYDVARVDPLPHCLKSNLFLVLTYLYLRVHREAGPMGW